MSIDEYFLRQASIFELRNIAREMGVLSPTIYKKEELISKVLRIQNGEEKPQMPKSRQGRPPKSVFVPTPNPTLPPTEKYISYKDIIMKSEPSPKRYYLERARNYTEVLANNDFSYNMESNSYSNQSKEFNMGYFNIVDDEFGFVFDLGGGSDVDEVVFVPHNLINSYALKSGDVVEYKSTYMQNSNAKFVYEILSVNNLKKPPLERPNFAKLDVMDNPSDLSLAPVITNDKEKNLFSAKRGSRNIICIKDMSLVRNIVKKFQSLKDEFHIINLLMDILPEDIASLGSSFQVENFYTTVGESNRQNIQTITLAIERAKRLTENGKKVIIIASEAKKLIRHKNFSLDYNVDDIKYKSLDLCYQLLTLSRRLTNGGEITSFLFFKKDKEPTSFERYVLEEFNTLSCDVFDMD